MKKILLIFLLIPPVYFFQYHSSAMPTPAASPLSIPAHAHNDFKHDHPLWDALHYGFTSIEVDLHLMAGIFFVGHNSEDIRPFKTLCSMYLDPLVHLVQANNGSVYSDGSGILLLIDIKSDGVESWIAMQKLLRKYEGLEEGGVSIVISGNRDLEAIATSQNTMARYDGRLDDLHSNPNMEIISLISANFSKEFTWRGEGPMKDSELEKLLNITESAHGQGRQVRFWATDVQSPQDQEHMWSQLLNAGVDFIGTDKLEEFSQFTHSEFFINSLKSTRDSGNQGDDSPHCSLASSKSNRRFSTP